MIVLHLKTQRGQPYGSERRCCEHCGVMIWHGPPEGSAWTDDLNADRRGPWQD